MEYKVRQSKVMTAVGAAVLIVAGALFGGLMVYAIIQAVSASNSEDLLLHVLVSACSLLVAIALIGVAIHTIWQYYHVVDIFQEDRLVRMSGNKVKYVVPYRDIAKVTRSPLLGECLIICKGPIKMQNGKNASKILMEFYSKTDFLKIQQIIGKCYFVPYDGDW